MQRRAYTTGSIAVLVAAAVIAAAPGGGAQGSSGAAGSPVMTVTPGSGTPTPASPAPAARPQEVKAVAPAEGSKVCPLPAVRVDLRLTDALRKAGTFDPAALRLVLDGGDVTRHLRALGTMDYPQGHASVSYTPKQPLKPGRHEAKLTLRTASGTTTYAWTFTVANVPCR